MHKTEEISCQNIAHVAWSPTASRVLVPTESWACSPPYAFLSAFWSSAIQWGFPMKHNLQHSRVSLGDISSVWQTPSLNQFQGEMKAALVILYHWGKTTPNIHNLKEKMFLLVQFIEASIHYQLAPIKEIEMQQRSSSSFMTLGKQTAKGGPGKRERVWKRCSQWLPLPSWLYLLLVSQL